MRTHPVLIDPPRRTMLLCGQHRDFDAAVKVRNPFRAGARVTFFGAKKVTKENISGPIQICHPERARDFSMRPPCLIEKRRTSCAPPSGSPLPEWYAGTELSPGRIACKAIRALLQDGRHSQRDLPFLMTRPTGSVLQKASPNMPTPVPFADRPDADSSVARSRGAGNPEGGAQDVRRFPMRQDASSENSGCGTGGRFELDLSVFFGHFLFEKKVTRAPARKRFQAFITSHETQMAGASQRTRAHRTDIVQERRWWPPLLTTAKASP